MWEKNDRIVKYIYIYPTKDKWELTAAILLMTIVGVNHRTSI